MTKHLLLVSVTFLGCSGPAKNTGPNDPSPRPSNTSPPMSPPQPGQTGDPTDCPAIQLKAPDSVSAGEKARFSAVLVGGPRSLTYTWSVSAGRIASGQHSAELVVDTGGLSGASITATLELGGLSTQCATTSATASLLVGPSS